MLQVWWACFLSMPASAGSYEFCILSLSCFLFERCAWFEGGSRVSTRQPTPFLLRRQKKWGKEKASLAGGLSGETHCAPASLRSDSHRKFEFLYGSTPVLQLACGVAQALRLELHLPQADEGASSRIEKDFSPSAADINCHQRHIQKQEPNQPLTPIQQALPAIKIEKNFSQADSPAAGLPTYPLQIRPWPGHTKTCADCGCC